MNALALLHAFEAAAVAVIVTALVGCARDSADESGQTVAYYRAHSAERVEMVRACANDPGRLQKTRACVNARAAERQAGIGSLRDLPPMGLPRAPSAGDTSHTPEPHREKEER